MTRNKIIEAVQVLQDGKVLLYPTDTVWGIGCDATNQEAVTRIYQIKKRNPEKSPVILLSDMEMLEQYAGKVSAALKKLISGAQQPTSIVISGFKGMAPNVYAEDGTVAIRIVSIDIIKQMIRAFGKPVVSTSANISGEVTPRSFEEISRYIIEAVDAVLDIPGHQSAVRPSRIIKWKDNGDWELIRE